MDERKPRLLRALNALYEASAERPSFGDAVIDPARASSEAGRRRGTRPARAVAQWTGGFVAVTDMSRSSAPVRAIPGC